MSFYTNQRRNNMTSKQEQDIDLISREVTQHLIADLENNDQLLDDDMEHPTDIIDNAIEELKEQLYKVYGY